jgi:hypothetical protein
MKNFTTSTSSMAAWMMDVLLDKHRHLFRPEVEINQLHRACIDCLLEIAKQEEIYT